MRFTVKKSKQEQNLVLLDEDESPVEDASEESEGSLHIETTEQADEFAEWSVGLSLLVISALTLCQQ